ncbi:hypothetical protein ACIMS1_004490 [Vibrio harveyi]
MRVHLYEVGDICSTTKCGDFKITKINNAHMVEIEFILTKTKRMVSFQQIALGTIRDIRYPALFGVGYIGEGKYVRKAHKAAYNKWYGILSKCYNPLSESYHRFGEKGIRVCKDWHDFQKFCAWYYEHEGLDETNSSRSHMIILIREDRDFESTNCRLSGRRKYW